MDKIEKQKQEQQYESYVKQKTPRHNVWGNMIKAFLTGGINCLDCPKTIAAAGPL